MKIIFFSSFQIRCVILFFHSCCYFRFLYFFPLKLWNRFYFFDILQYLWVALCLLHNFFFNMFFRIVNIGLSRFEIYLNKIIIGITVRGIIRLKLSTDILEAFLCKQPFGSGHYFLNEWLSATLVTLLFAIPFYFLVSSLLYLIYNRWYKLKFTPRRE